MSRVPPSRRSADVAAAVFVLSLFVAACSGSGATPGPSGSAPASSPSGSAAASGESPMPSFAADPDIIEPVLADAAQRAGVAPEQVVVQDVTHVTWSDGALGCPQPGMYYTQAEVDGWQAIVDAGGTRLDYRIRGPGQFILCEGIGG